MRYRIRRDTVQIADLAPGEPFRIDRTDYPGDWLARGGAVPGHDVLAYDPPPPPPAPPARWTVGWLTLLERLGDGEAAALAAFVDALPVKAREAIRARGARSDDPALRAEISRLGADPDQALAP
jgi:hypothetical protein